MDGSAVSVRALYDLWAPLYPPEAHNPLMRLEQSAMLRLLPAVQGSRALDLACGTGRYARILSERGAASVTALDFSKVMLAGAAAPDRVCASMMDLPLTSGSFDVVVSGLAVGHADNLRRWMSEAARVLLHGGTLLYSDFHPFAKQAGWRRTFRGLDGCTRALPFNAHEPAEHVAAARTLGLSVQSLEELRVDIELTESFPGSADFYRRWHGKPIVLVAMLQKV
jgi:malonyl-CoA O-methyltransferase